MRIRRPVLARPRLRRARERVHRLGRPAGFLDVGDRPRNVQPVDGGGERRPRRRGAPARGARDLLERRSGRGAAVVRPVVARLLAIWVMARARPQPGPQAVGHLHRCVRHAAGRARAGVHGSERRPRHLSGRRHLRSAGHVAGRRHRRHPRRREPDPLRQLHRVGGARPPRSRRRARRPKNLTIDSNGVPPAAIDSRALDGAPVPGPRAARHDDRRRARRGAAGPGVVLHARRSASA